MPYGMQRDLAQHPALHSTEQVSMHQDQLTQTDQSANQCRNCVLLSSGGYLDTTYQCTVLQEHL